MGVQKSSGDVKEKVLKNAVCCPMCGYPVQRNHIYCEHCGEFQIQSDGRQNTKRRKHLESDHWKWCDKCKSYRKAPLRVNFCFRCGSALTHLVVIIK